MLKGNWFLHTDNHINIRREIDITMMAIEKTLQDTLILKSPISVVDIWSRWMNLLRCSNWLPLFTDFVSSHKPNSTSLSGIVSINGEEILHLRSGIANGSGNDSVSKILRKIYADYYVLKLQELQQFSWRSSSITFKWELGEWTPHLKPGFRGVFFKWR